jgi:hypothetical protein
VTSHIGTQALSLSDVIYRANKLARAEDGQGVYDPTSIVSRFDSKDAKPSLSEGKSLSELSSIEFQSVNDFVKIGIGEPKE